MLLAILLLSVTWKVAMLLETGNKLLRIEHLSNSWQQVAATCFSLVYSGIKVLTNKSALSAGVLPLQKVVAWQNYTIVHRYIYGYTITTAPPPDTVLLLLLALSVANHNAE